MRDRKGFTITETVMVLVIMGIMAVVTIIVISNAMRGMQLSNAADKLVSDLRYAQTMANGTGTWYGVSFETTPTSEYTLYTTTGTIDTVVENPGKRGSNFIVNVNSSFGVSISSVTIEAGKKIEFDPLGTPYTDRTGAALSSEATVSFRLGSSSRTVRIAPGTGRVYIQ
jgi:prepilin-type N-terminal cleavage/methylation domain-containing protein